MHKIPPLRIGKRPLWGKPTFVKYPVADALRSLCPLTNAPMGLAVLMRDLERGTFENKAPIPIQTPIPRGGGAGGDKQAGSFLSFELPGFGI